MLKQVLCRQTALLVNALNNLRGCVILQRFFVHIPLQWCNLHLSSGHYYTLDQEVYNEMISIRDFYITFTMGSGLPSDCFII